MRDRDGPVTSAYSVRASEYVDAFGGVEHTVHSDVAFIERWATDVEGTVIDVGCGPGHWTHHLAEIGVEVEGIDPVVDFIESARRRFPHASFRVGRGEALGVSDGTLGGILAWYSLIHIDPLQLAEVFAEFARCLRPGGRLALGFFTGPVVEPFEHAIATAFYWPVDALCEEIERAGFAIIHRETRHDAGFRPHGALIAERLGDIARFRPPP